MKVNRSVIEPSVALSLLLTHERASNGSLIWGDSVEWTKWQWISIKSNFDGCAKIQLIVNFHWVRRMMSSMVEFIALVARNESKSATDCFCVTKCPLFQLLKSIEKVLIWFFSLYLYYTGRQARSHKSTWKSFELSKSLEKALIWNERPLIWVPN